MTSHPEVATVRQSQTAAASVVLECAGLSKRFHDGERTIEALRGISMRLQRGRATVLFGPSGSGKTTLLSVLGCLLSPCSGELRIAGRRVDSLDSRICNEIRRKHIGFVFQNANLLPFLTMQENLLVAGRLASLRSPELESRGRELLKALGVEHLANTLPAKASGGEKQRVAIARALIGKPSVVLGDEPTASLDWENAVRATRLLVDQIRSSDSVLLMVSHDTRLFEYFDEVMRIENGELAPWQS